MRRPAAQALARRQAQRLKGAPARLFHQKLIAYLARRGFSYELASTVSQNLWEELHDETNTHPQNSED
jgi:SOS response regulatory protein OraA/RecX